MIEEQGHDVRKVFRVELYDLHLGQQEVSWGENAFRLVKAIPQIDSVAHPDLVEEDIDLTIVHSVPVAQTSPALQRVERHVRRVPQAEQEGLHRNPLG